MENKIVGRVTEKKLDAWIAENHPELVAAESGDYKGFYRRDVGYAHGFHTCGTTWKEVAAELEAIDISDR